MVYIPIKFPVDSLKYANGKAASEGVLILLFVLKILKL